MLQQCFPNRVRWRLWMSPPALEVTVEAFVGIGVSWWPQAVISTNMILIEICECRPWTNFAKTIIYIIRVLLVYLESAKTYTGPEIVRVLKRLGNTVLQQPFLTLLAKYVTSCFDG